MDAKGRTKLDFLIQTWKDRQFFNEALQADLEALAKDKMSQQAPYLQIQSQPPPAPAAAHQPAMQHRHLPPPPSLTVPPQPSVQGNYESVLAEEKQALLLELLQSLGQDVNAISLEELAATNVDLYNQICGSAEANARVKMNMGAPGVAGSTPSAPQALSTSVNRAGATKIVDGLSSQQQRQLD